MKPIHANTRIAHLIKAHPDALETIIGISTKFEKYRNPLLRKLLVGRTDIEMAAEIASCDITTFFEKLKPLGFEIEASIAKNEKMKNNVPNFITSLKKEEIIDFDVRELLAAGNDPLSLILDKIKIIQAGQALKIINTFEPVPLIKMLERQGFEIYSDKISNDLVETYFYKPSENTTTLLPDIGENSGWQEILNKFKDHLVTIDVRELEMPLPMHTILSELETLPKDKALFVYHKRIPLFLLPELAEKKFEYRINEIGEGEVHLLIYKD